MIKRYVASWVTTKRTSALLGKDAIIFRDVIHIPIYIYLYIYIPIYIYILVGGFKPFFFHFIYGIILLETTKQ